MDEYFENEFYRQLEKVDRSSIPGYCQMALFGTTNGECLGWNGLKYDPVKVKYLHKLVKDSLTSHVERKIESDNIKVFIKQEPQKKKKIGQRLQRLA